MALLLLSPEPPPAIEPAAGNRDYAVADADEALASALARQVPCVRGQLCRTNSDATRCLEDAAQLCDVVAYLRK
jgi:hypothetical protein